MTDTRLTLLMIILLSDVAVSIDTRGRYCATGCVPQHYGCHCQHKCRCKQWFDCDDGPSGTGRCICQYSRWKLCKEFNPLKPEKNRWFQNRNICEVEVKTRRKLNHIDENTSRASRKVFAMISHVLPTQTGTSVTTLLQNRRLSNYLFPSESLFEALTPCLSGEDLCEGSRPYARGYSGHQFGSFAGQLGDGRAITIGHTADGSMEVSLKGAGRTMFSRFGDGMASLYSVCRELLGSVYLHSIGVPVIQSLAVFSKADSFIYRDEWYHGSTEIIPAGVLVRVGESFLRFGSVQHAAKQVGFDAVVAVARDASQVLERMQKITSAQLLHAAHDVDDDDARRRCFFIGKVETRSCSQPVNEMTDTDILRCLFEKIVQRSAALVATWMSIGFAHGVMNTDNMSLIGSTIDLNVFGFVTSYDSTFTPNFIDTESRYAFGRQKNIMLWNLQRLSDALTGTPFYDDDDHSTKDTWMLHSDKWLSQSAAEEILNTYHKEYEYCFNQRMQQRLGLEYSNFNKKQKETLVSNLMSALEDDGMNYHYFSRNVVDLDVRDVKTQELASEILSLRKSVTDIERWRDHVQSVVPSYVFGNNKIAELLRKDSFSPSLLQEVLEKFYNPFVHTGNYPMYSSEKVVQTSCGGQ